MCLIGFAWQSSVEYPFALVANRDEFHARPSQHLHWWTDAPIAAGRDLEAGGSWLGVNKAGRFAAITNIRDGHNPSNDYPTSRGELVRQLLMRTEPLANTEAFIQDRMQQINGFNLLYGDLFGEHAELRFITNRPTNRDLDQFVVQPGVYSFSNGAFNAQWPKTQKSRLKLKQALRHRSPAGFWQVLESREPADLGELPNTGVGEEMEEFLSPVFIVGENYGTRSSHRILCRQQNIDIGERRYDQFGELTGVSNIRITHNA